METKQWRTIDKSSWPTRGEWDDEPDKMQWQDEATGLPCLIVRGPSGALCGYVGVAEGHPMFRTHYDAAPIADVHGGLTFSDFCADTDDESRHICPVNSYLVFMRTPALSACGPSQQTAEPACGQCRHVLRWWRDSVSVRSGTCGSRRGFRLPARFAASAWFPSALSCAP